MHIQRYHVICSIYKQNVHLHQVLILGIKHNTCIIIKTSKDEMHKKLVSHLMLVSVLKLTVLSGLSYFLLHARCLVCDQLI